MQISTNSGRIAEQEYFYGEQYFFKFSVWFQQRIHIVSPRNVHLNIISIHSGRVAEQTGDFYGEQYFLKFSVLFQQQIQWLESPYEVLKLKDI